MKGSLPIARVAGIDVRVHWTFVFILVLGAFQWGSVYKHGTPGAAFGMLLMILLFACVVLHELGHSLVAQAFGLKVKEIVLFPIGGVAQLSENPKKPAHELLIAVTGPLVNMAIAAALWLFAGVRSIPTLDGKGMAVPGALTTPSVQTLLVWLFAANVSLAVFNLIPAFPMDGGRVLRAALAMGLGFPRATRIATSIGQLLAFLMGIYAVVNGHFLLALIALFVFLGAGGERAEEQARTVLQTLRVGDAYNRHALTLTPGDHISTVVDYILTSYQPDFAVMQGKTLLGVVTRQEVLQALATQTDDVYVAGVMNRDVLRVPKAARLDEVRETLMKAGARIAAVQDDETFLGLVSLEDISEALLVSTFVQMQAQRRQAASAV